METSQLFYNVDWMEWDLWDNLQPTESTYNLHPSRFPFLAVLQTLIEFFGSGNPHSIIFESSIRMTEQLFLMR